MKFSTRSRDPRAQESGQCVGSEVADDRFLENDGGVGGKERDSTASIHRLWIFFWKLENSCGFEIFLQLVRQRVSGLT